MAIILDKMDNIMRALDTFEVSMVDATMRPVDAKARTFALTKFDELNKTVKDWQDSKEFNDSR